MQTHISEFEHFPSLVKQAGAGQERGKELEKSCSVPYGPAKKERTLLLFLLTLPLPACWTEKGNAPNSS